MKEKLLHHSKLDIQSINVDSGLVEKQLNGLFETSSKKRKTEQLHQIDIAPLWESSNIPISHEYYMAYHNQDSKGELERLSATESSFKNKSKDGLLVLPYPEYTLSKKLIGKHAVMLEIRDGFYPFLYFAFRSTTTKTNVPIKIQFELKDNVLEYPIYGMQFFKVDKDFESTYRTFNAYESQSVIHL